MGMKKVFSFRLICWIWILTILLVTLISCGGIRGTRTRRAAPVIGQLLTAGYLNEALKVAETASIEDSVKSILSLKIDIYGRLGDLQRAEEAYELAKNFNTEAVYPNYDVRRITGARLLSGKAVSKKDILSPEPVMVALKEYVGSPQEGLGELRRFFNDDDYQDSQNLIGIWMWATYFGDTELAMEAMEKVFSITSAPIDIAWYPAMKQVRQTPQFKKIVREIGLVDNWEQYGWPDLCYPTDNGDFVCD